MAECKARFASTGAFAVSSVARKAPHLASPCAGMLFLRHRLPQAEIPGPWCPSRVMDGAEAGGIRFVGGDTVGVDGSFKIGLAGAVAVAGVAVSPRPLADADGRDDLDACYGHEGNGPSCQSDAETAGYDRIPDFLEAETGGSFVRSRTVGNASLQRPRLGQQTAVDIKKPLGSGFITRTTPQRPMRMPTRRPWGTCRSGLQRAASP